MTQFKAVLFDIDGTLVDSLGMLVRGLGDTYERYSGYRPADEEIRASIGLPLTEQMLKYREEPPSAELREEMIGYTIERYDVHQNHETVFEPALEALRRCHQAGIKTALVTSKNQAELGPFIDRFAGSRYVDVFVCASDVVHPKPKPDAALLACERLGVRPDEAIFIGDSAFDMQCGRAAGTATLAVTYGSVSADVLKAEQPDILLRTPEDLLDWVSTSLLQTPCHERS